MDPFYEVEQDCHQQFKSLEDFISRQYQITNDVIQDYNNQRTDIIETIDDLRQSVESIQLNPDLYPNVDHIELSNRALKVSNLTESLNKLNLKWNDKLIHKDVTTMSNRISQEFDSNDNNNKRTGDDSDSNFQSTFQQQEIIREQDQHLDNIHQTMQNLHLQAMTMGEELEDQHVLLEQFDQEMDTVSDKLKNGLKRIDYFLERNRDKASDCCILLLIVALVVLLFILIIL